VLFKKDVAGHAQFAANDVMEACRKDDQARSNARSIRKLDALKVLARLNVGYLSGDELDRCRQLRTNGVDEIVIEKSQMRAMRPVDDPAVPRVDNFVKRCGDGKRAIEQAQALQHADLRTCNFLGAEFRRMLCVAVEQSNAIALPPENDGRERSTQAATDYRNVDLARCFGSFN
jgi:hypothetical protein